MMTIVTMSTTIYYFFTYYMPGIVLYTFICKNI